MQTGGTQTKTFVTFGQWIKRLRAAQDLTQEHLAEDVACAVQTIRAFENGARRPSLEMAERLADILQVPAAERSYFLKLARQPASTAATTAVEGPAPALLVHPAPDGAPPRRPRLPLTALIGRATESDAIRRLLLAERLRLVTLVGPGGVGKSRLAIQLAHELADHFAQGALWIALAPVDHADAIPLLIAEALDATLDGALAPAAQLDLLLGGRQFLLVLDNFEHLLDSDNADAAVSMLDHILGHAEGVQVLITSRERLRLNGEHIIELDGLGAPAPSQLDDLTLDDLATYDAVMLFLERARHIDRQFALNRDNQADVARVCALLQGMPLAVELAASWVRMLSPREIVDEITGGIDFLALSDRTMAARHKSMRAVFDHSWALLPPEERSALARLAIFRGGFDRTAAHSVAGTTLPLLAALVDKSLVQSSAMATGHDRSAHRYDLHELLRQYLYDRLVAAGEEQIIGARHAQYYAQLAEQSAPALMLSENRRWVQRLEVDQGNLNAALHWSLQQGHDPALGLRLAAGLGRFWYLADQWREGRTWLTLALRQVALQQPDDPSYAHALAVARLAEICLSLSDLAESQRYFDQAIALWRRLNESEQLAWTLFQAGSLATARGRDAAAEACFEESLALYRAAGSRGRVAMVLIHRASAAVVHARYAEAVAMVEECLPVFREAGYQGSMTAALNLLGRARLGLGEFDRAVAFFGEALDHARQRGSQSGMAWALLNLGLAYTTQGDVVTGRRHYLDALAVYWQIDRRGGVLATVEGLAACLAVGDRAADAVRLMAATETLRSAIDESLTTQEAEMRAAALAATRSRLDEAAWQHAWQQGAVYSVEQAVALARGSGAA